MAHLQMRVARGLAGVVVASALLLSGCADGVDLNGKMFDWMGISPAAQEARKTEPRMADRAPLVVPPNVNQLPEPGSGAVPPAHVAWPDDPEQRRVREAQERERLHLAYCSGDAKWQERALDKYSNAPRSPYGPCPSIFGNITTNVNKD